MGFSMHFWFSVQGWIRAVVSSLGPTGVCLLSSARKKFRRHLIADIVLLSGMVKTGGLFTLIGKRQSAAPAEKPEENKYSVCSKFPDSSGPEIVFDEELRVHLMDG